VPLFRVLVTGDYLDDAKELLEASRRVRGTDERSFGSVAVPSRFDPELYAVVDDPGGGPPNGPESLADRYEIGAAEPWPD
jgi:hypothetical protein